MGTTRDDFIKYPRTPHLFGSKGTDDDKRLGRKESERFIADPSLIVEEKLDGTNVGIHFTSHGRMLLQCRGHEITEGMHPQYDLFKQWTSVKRPELEAMLGSRFILYGEWLYAKHSVHYRALPHYFFEFDLYDKDAAQFLDLATRLRMLDGSGLHTVPVLHRGPGTAEELRTLIGRSGFDSAFDNPVTGRTDHLIEGLYLRTEAGGRVTGRAKMVRPEFVEKVKQSEHWQHQALVPNELAEGAEILEIGKVSTNIYLRRIHNFALDMTWLPWPVIVKRQWPKVQFKDKRAITWEEHQAIVARELNPERKAFYQLAWHSRHRKHDQCGAAVSVCWRPGGLRDSDSTTRLPTCCYRPN